MRRCLRLLCALSAAIALSACEGAVEQGAVAFEQGDVPTALATWQAAADEGSPSGVLLYDIGNAHFRQGDLPRAIASWRAARLVRPRDARIVHNLALARSRLTGLPEPARAPVAWLEVATPGEVGLLATFLLLVASGGAWWHRRGSDGTERMTTWGVPWLVLGLLGLALGLAAIDGWRKISAHPIAVIVAQEAVVRDAARIEGHERFRLKAGTEVTVDSRLGPFLLVRTGDERRGWVPAEAALVLDP